MVNAGGFRSADSVGRVEHGKTAIMVTYKTTFGVILTCVDKVSCDVAQVVNTEAISGQCAWRIKHCEVSILGTYKSAWPLIRAKKPSGNIASRINAVAIGEDSLACVKNDKGPILIADKTASPVILSGIKEPPRRVA